MSAALLGTIAGPTNGISAQDDLTCDAEPVVTTTADGVDFVRTPDACFAGLPDWPYEPQYVEVDGLRQAYVDEGPADGEVVLLLHGQPSWSYLYRDMIPVLVDAGYRVVAMDHLGMGRSDKPIDIEDYSYLGHNERLQTFVEELELTDINLFVQDWGSLIGLRTAGLDPDRYATIAVGDGALPVIPAGFEPFPPVEDPHVLTDLEFTGAQIPAQQVPFFDGCEPILSADPSYFGDWMAYAMTAESFMPSVIVEAMTWFDVPPEEEAAYDAPFPSRIYMAGPRVFPSLVNEVPGTTAEAWAGLTAYEKPFLTLWASNDPGNLGSCEAQQRFIDSIPGAEGQPHDRLPEASHFLQDDQGTEIASRLVDWYASLEGDETAVDGGSTDAADGASVSADWPAYHDGYWVTEVENPQLPAPVTVINDMHIDETTGRATVYAQSRVLGQVLSPPQVGPGECLETPLGETHCFHPNAVYLNGSGAESDAVDGPGAWWVKHSWVVDGEGYLNCELTPQETYDDCVWVEGVLLDDGLSMQIGPTGELEGFYNIRTPLLDREPIAYQVTRYAPASTDPEAGEADPASTPQFVLTFDCVEEASAFDGLVRSCPALAD